MKNLKFFLLIISITVNAQKGNGIALQQLRPTQPNYNYNYNYNPYLNNNKKDNRDWENISKVYIKTECSYCLDDSGRNIDFVFIPKNDALKSGNYKVELTDFRNDLYQIKGTDIYIKFSGYHGYAGYGQAGILSVDSYGYVKFSKDE